MELINSPLDKGINKIFTVETKIKKLNVLVIDDLQRNIDEALLQLKNHEVTVCTTFLEASRILAGADSPSRYNESAILPFDAVLTDLLMPTSPIGVSEPVQDWEKEEDVIARETPGVIEKFGPLMPYGLIIVLTCIRRNIPVALLSNGGHHNHPMNWAIDLIGYEGNEISSLGGVPFYTSGRRIYPDEMISKYPWLLVDESSQTRPHLKNWIGALEKLFPQKL